MCKAWSAFCFFQEVFHVAISQRLHLFEKLSVRALWDHLLLHHGAEDSIHLPDGIMSIWNIMYFIKPGAEICTID